MTNKTEQDQARIKANRKAARKTAMILGLVALGLFTYSVYIVINHANS